MTIGPVGDEAFEPTVIDHDIDFPLSMMLCMLPLFSVGQVPFAVGNIVGILPLPPAGPLDDPLDDPLDEPLPEPLEDLPLLDPPEPDPEPDLPLLDVLPLPELPLDDPPLLAEPPLEEAPLELPLGGPFSEKLVLGVLPPHADASAKMSSGARGAMSKRCPARKRMVFLLWSAKVRDPRVCGHPAPLCDSDEHPQSH
jgi:hypothetical protein